MVILVTICAFPVQRSVTTIQGHENVRNSSKDSKNTPQERSNLDAGRAWSVSQEGECVRHAAAPRNTVQLEVAHVGVVDLVGKELAIPTQYTCKGRTHRLEVVLPSLGVHEVEVGHYYCLVLTNAKRICNKRQTAAGTDGEAAIREADDLGV